MTDIAVLISGRGSNLRALAAAIGDGRLHAKIALVVSNRADAAGLQWARGVGLETAVLSVSRDGTRLIVEVIDDAQLDTIRDVVADAGAGIKRLERRRRSLEDAFLELLDLPPTLTGTV